MHIFSFRVVCVQRRFLQSHTHTRTHTHITRNTHALVCVGDFMSAVTVQDMLRALDAIASIRYGHPNLVFSKQLLFSVRVAELQGPPVTNLHNSNCVLQNFCGDFAWAVQKHGIRTRSPFVSLSRNTSSPTRHTTSPPLEPHTNHTTTTVRGLVVCWVVREGCGRKGDVAPPHYLPHHNHVRHSTTTSPVPTLHHQEGSTTARSLSQNFTDRTVLQNLWRFFSQHATPPRHTTPTTQQSWCAGSCGAGRLWC